MGADIKTFFLGRNGKGRGGTADLSGQQRTDGAASVDVIKLRHGRHICNGTSLSAQIFDGALL
jgi:hypothetical protein